LKRKKEKSSGKKEKKKRRDWIQEFFKNFSRNLQEIPIHLCQFAPFGAKKKPILLEQYRPFVLTISNFTFAIVKDTPYNDNFVIG